MKVVFDVQMHVALILKQRLIYFFRINTSIWFLLNDTREINKNEFMISFNENQIEFSSTPIPESTLDLERKYKTLLNKRSGNNSNISPIANRLISGTFSKN